MVSQHLVNPSGFSGALSCMRGRGCLGRPFLEHKKGANIQDALIISGGGPDGYHTLEALQCMVERRAGGEAGVAAVTVLKGAEMWCAPRLSCLHIVRVSVFGQYCYSPHTGVLGRRWMLMVAGPASSPTLHSEQSRPRRLVSLASI